MIVLLEIILFVCIFLIVYTYFLYPFFVALIAKNKSLTIRGEEKKNLPKIALVFAAYNEEKIIEAKMKNLASLNYPSDLLEIHIGLDHPNDATAMLISQEYGINHSMCLHHFKKREGKANVLNKLFKYKLELSDYDIIVMMDANIISKQNLLFELAKYFENPSIGQVGAVIENVVKAPTEIANQEKFYIGNEGQLKVNEGLVFGSSIGAFGACYAIRSSLVKPIPANFLMEDFYLSMHVLQSGFSSVTNPDAIVYEDLPGSIKEEFKRKRRISTGNFQNLSVYFSMLWTANFKVSFPFLSHKILRWLTPFFMIAGIMTSSSLFFIKPNSALYCFLFFMMLLNLILPILDIVLQRININVNLLRLHRYFMSMNLALFLGFIDWIKGVETNIWKPTERT